MTAGGGLFQAPAAPPVTPRLRIEPGSTPRRLSLAIVRAALAWVGAGAALVVLYNVATMMLPLVIGGVIDAVVAPAAGGARPGDLVGTMVWWGSAVVGLYVIMNLSYRFGGRIGWYGLQRTEYELSQAVAARILDPRGFAGNQAAPGALLSVATADVHRACLVLYAAVYPPGEIVGLVVAIGILFGVHPWLGLGVLVALPLVVGIMHLAARPLRRRSLTEQAGIADAAASAADLVAGFRVIRGVHAEDEASRRYRAVSRSALTGTIAARDARAAYTGLSAAIAGVFAAAVLAAAVLLALDGAITAGGLVTVGGVAVSIVGPLDALVSQLGAILAMSQASTARVLDLLDRPRDERALGDSRPGAALRIENLLLPGGLTVDADVPAGEMSVLAVPAPARRELAEVLAGRGAAGGGRVLLGGVDLAECHVDARRERMLVVPHRPDILAGTVLENVRTAGPDGATPEEAREALRLAGMTDAELPDGEGTACAEGGTNLSGGQRQRIALARAIAADPEILVLLEPTSSVDSVTETAIAGDLARHRRGRTTLVVTGSGAFAHAAATRLTARGSDD